MMREPLTKDTILKDKYIVTELLSEKGSSSLIYKGHALDENGNVQTMNPVIIKEFYPKEWSDAGYLKRLDTGIICEEEYNDTFQKELECFREQSSINNVCGYDEETDSRTLGSSYMESFNENGTAYIVSTSFNGITLSQYIKEKGTLQKKEDFTRIVKLIKSVAFAVDEQHRSEYLNLDITPDNLFLSRTPGGYSISVIDYGSCLPLSDEYTNEDIELIAWRVTQSGEYSSKNVKNLYKNKRQFLLIDDQSKYDWYEETIKMLTPADDIYSISVLFFEMLTGSRTLGNYKTEINSIGYLNAAEKDLLEDVISNGLNLAYNSITQFNNDIEYLIDVIMRRGLSKHTLWAISADYYYKRSNSVIFKTEHISELNPNLKPIKLTVIGNMNGIFQDKIFDLIELCGNEDIYIKGVGGAGKSFVAAELFKNNLEKGIKIPFLLDIGKIEKQLTENILDEDIILKNIIQSYSMQVSLGDVKNEFARINEKGPQYMIIIDNLHKAREDMKSSISLNLKRLNDKKCFGNVQLIVLGRDDYRYINQDYTYERDKNSINIITIIGVDKIDLKQLNIKLPHSKLFDIPLFIMLYREITVYSNNADKSYMAFNDGMLMSIYFKNLKEYITNVEFAHVNAYNSNNINTIIEKILPQFAYDILVKKKIIKVGEIETSYLKKSLGDCSITQFMDIVTNNLGIIEEDLGIICFTHDCYAEYFSGVHIASNVNEILREKELFFTSKNAAIINHIWDSASSKIARWILIKENTISYIEELIALLNSQRDNHFISEVYKYLPFNMAKMNTSFRYETIYDWIDDVIFLEWEQNIIQQCAEIGQCFNDGYSLNMIGLLNIYNCEYDKAYDYLSKGETHKGYFNTALMYMFELGRNYDEEKILYWMGRAAEIGDVLAKNYFVIKMLATNVDLFALNWIVKLDERKESTDQLDMGARLYDEILEANINSFNDHMGIVFAYADKGFAPAQYHVANLLEKEKNELFEYERIVKLYASAADSNYAPAINKFGEMFEKGDVIVRDSNKAAKAYNHASKLGYRPADYNLARILLEKKSYKPALFIYEKLVKENDSTAQRIVGNMYEHGLGVNRNIERAREMYKSAADNGDIEALAALERLGL